MPHCSENRIIHIKVYTHTGKMGKSYARNINTQKYYKYYISDVISYEQQLLFIDNITICIRCGHAVFKIFLKNALISVHELFQPREDVVRAELWI